MSGPLPGGAHHPDAHDWVLRVSESGGFVNDTDEPVDPELAVTYWRHRWAAAAVALTAAIEKQEQPKYRATSLSPPEFGLLCHWGHRVKLAFESMPYLVGSVERGERNWRDVDVRVLLDEDEWDALVGRGGLRLQALNLSVSLWGRQATGLPIDFQFQRTYDANEEFAGHERGAIGIDPSIRWKQEPEQSAVTKLCHQAPDDVPASDEQGGSHGEG